MILEVTRRMRIRGPLGLFFLVVLLFVSAGVGPAAGADDFPPVTQEEWDLEEVPGEPEADAVVLNATAEVWLLDIRNLLPNSTLRVVKRLKVLTPQGAERYGEIRIPHSRQVLLSSFEGRTMLPDGGELSVPKNAIFRSVASRSDRQFATSVAFPGVEPGAILDWSYEISFNSLFLLRPWYFQEEIPVLHSEVIYHVPGILAVRPWGEPPPDQPFQKEILKEGEGHEFRVWLENLPAVPKEPYSFPAADLQAHFMLIPHKMGYIDGFNVSLMSSWSEVCQMTYEADYRWMGKRTKPLKRLASQLETLASEASRSEGRQAIAEEMFRFVRDEIRTLPWDSVFTRSKIDLNDVMEKGEGTSSEKALLLHTMLDLMEIEADLVWVPNRWYGTINPKVPNPGWFEKVMVLVRLPFDGGEETVLLDPADSRLGFGHINPTNEDVPAIVFDTKKPRGIAIPLSPASQNRRRAKLDLALDAEGRLGGSGEMELTGHHAWRRMSTGESEEDIVEDWQEWLVERWDGFDIAAVEVEEDREDRRIKVRWTLTQREEEVLGDESSLLLSRPLGPIAQIFQLEPEQRETPVLLFFPDVDEVEARITWPEGWEVEAAPLTAGMENAAGRSSTSVTIDQDARAATYSRSMVVLHRQFEGSDEYRAVRDLYAAMEISDAQALVLVAR